MEQFKRCFFIHKYVPIKTLKLNTWQAVHVYLMSSGCIKNIEDIEKSILVLYFDHINETV